MPTRPPIHRPRASRAKHAPKQAPQTNRQATRALHTDSKAWRRIRERVLVRDMYQCAHCQKFGDQVDHKDGDSGHNPEDGSNWQTLCRSCHSRKTAKEQGGFGNGRPRSPERTG